jgi:hypothetical protein
MFGVFVRVLAVAFALFPALALAQSPVLPGFPPGVFQSRAALDAAPSGGACSQATAFLARNGGANSAATTTLICGLVTDGTFAKLDVLYIFATDTQAHAVLNLISTSFTGTANGTVSFSANHGFTGDGSSFFIDSGYTPSTSGLNYTQNSGAIGAYLLNNRTTPSGAASFGAIEGGFANSALITPLGDNISNAAGSAQTNSGTVSRAIFTTTAQGMSSFNVTSASAQTFYRNGASIATASVATTGVPNVSIYLFVLDLGGSPFSGSGYAFSSDQMSAFFLGGNLSSTDILNVHSRINAYMTALGINVY